MNAVNNAVSGVKGLVCIIMSIFIFTIDFVRIEPISEIYAALVFLVGLGFLMLGGFMITEASQ